MPGNWFLKSVKKFSTKLEGIKKKMSSRLSSGSGYREKIEKAAAKVKAAVKNNNKTQT